MGARKRKKGVAHSGAESGRAGRNGWGRLTGWLIMIGAVTVAAGTMFLMVRGGTPEAPPQPQVSVRNEVLAAEIRDPRVGEVERKFLCPCGNCGLQLSECTCDNANGALEMKKTIVALLTSGLDEKAVVATLTSRFPGSLRDEKAVPETVEQPVEAASGDSFALIVAKLDCVCGNCRKTLAECDCAHPNGAAEVKAFIKQRLAEGFNVSDVLSAVKRVYGNRVF
jgi:cytochrome c-type biogenesis protein CcmH/NrfF